jgi:xanthine dehydrogenase YagR molybdenum-binding subunit
MADTMKYVGQSMPKVDSLARLTGLAQFTDDMPLPPRTAHAMLVHSPYAHARIRAIDSTAAEAVPGVIAVLDYRREDMKFRWFSGDRGYERWLFNQELRYHGEIVAMVVAEDRYTAEDAARLLNIDYEVLPHVIDSQEALRPDAPQLHEKGNLVGGKSSVYTRGDVQQGLAAADFVLDEKFETQFQHNAQMEPRVALAMWEGAKLTIWTPTQGVTNAKIGIAQDLGIPQSNVRVICQYMGGGFGQKNGNQNIDTLVAAASRAIGRPLKLWMGRAGDMSEMHGRWSTKQAYKLGVKKDGTITGLDFTGYSNIGAWAKSTGAIYGAREMLDTEHVRAELFPVYTNQQNSGNFRAPPDPQGVFSMAQLIDMTAEKLGIAGVDLPEFNISVATKKADQQDEYTVYLLPDIIRLGADAVGWNQKWHPPASSQLPDGRWHGLGMAWGTWGAGLGLGSAIVKINADGTAHLLTGVTDIGGGAKTTMILFAAEVLGIPPERWQSTWGDTDTTSYSVGESGSRNTGHTGPAVLAAAMDAKKKLIQGAVSLLKVNSPDELDAADETIFVKSDPSRSVTYGNVAERSQGSIIGTAFTRETVPEGKSRDAWVAGFAEVAVDKPFGKIQVLHYTSVHDGGRIINRLTAESQAHGGVTMGIGMALFEELLWDRATGNHLNTNIHDYRVPTHLDIPKVDVIFLDRPDPYGPLGAKPMGEPPIVPVPGAIANAVYNAIGVRMTKLPMNPHNVLAAIGAGRTA